MHQLLSVLSAILAILAVGFMAAFGYNCLIQQWEAAAHCALWSFIAVVAALATGRPDGF